MSDSPALASRVPGRFVCGMAYIALIGIVVNLLVLVAAPVLRPDLNLLEKSLSYYAVGPWGMLQAVAFVAFGIASMALGVALLRAQIASRWLRVSVLLLVVAGVASLGLVWYPMGSPGPVTMVGDAHQTAGTLSGVALLAAALAFAFAIRSDPTWRGLTLTAAIMFTIAVIGAVLSQFAIWWPDIGIPMGATMRLLALPLVILWGLVAWRLRRTCGDAASRFSGAR